MRSIVYTVAIVVAGLVVAGLVVAVSSWQISPSPLPPLPRSTRSPPPTSTPSGAGRSRRRSTSTSPTPCTTTSRCFEKYPDYVFSFEGAFRYQLMKEYYPAEYARLKEYVSAGRWRVAGCWVDAVDTNMPSPESLIRHALYGNGCFEREFGVRIASTSSCPTASASATRCRVTAHCGPDGLLDPEAHLGLGLRHARSTWGVWRGVDGPSVLAALNPGAYGSEIEDDLTRDADVAGRDRPHRRPHGGPPVAFKYFGTGDAGGAPTESSVQWLEREPRRPAARCRCLGAAPTSSSATSRPPRPTRCRCYDGELLMTSHGTGCYTSEAAMKRWNRQQRAPRRRRRARRRRWPGGWAARTYPREELDARLDALPLAPVPRRPHRHQHPRGVRRSAGTTSCSASRSSRRC